MYRKEVNAQSPLRILQKSIHGGLGKGNLGVVLSPAGVGKTAFLIQVGLDDLMHERDVLHVAVGASVEHVSAWYDALFDDLATRNNLQERDSVHGSLARHRVIKTFPENGFDPQKLEEALELFSKHMGMKPQSILIDGFPWGENAPAVVGSLKAIAGRIGAELWMTATTPRGQKVQTAIGAPCDRCAASIDVGVFLEPQGSHVAVRLLKDHQNPTPADAILQLHPETMRLVAEGEAANAVKVPASAYTLLSGGATGAEAEFGVCAERWGLAEENFSFVGRGSVRGRGLVELSDEELQQGDVSSAYLKAHMHRTYPDTPLFKKVLQSIWHQVNTAGEVFHIGQLQDDLTVRGGTGWAVELAKHWGKPVHVFDQEKKGWFLWKDGAWAPESAPTITRERFTGTGTRFLNDEGKAAVVSLFERSFGPAKA
jgi:hypothetical protein